MALDKKFVEEQPLRLKFNEGYIVDLLLENPKAVRRACIVLSEWNEVDWFLSDFETRLILNPDTDFNFATGICCRHWKYLQKEAIRKAKNRAIALNGGGKLVGREKDI